MSHDSLPSGLVTFLFTDIEGSTRLAHALGPGYRAVLAEHRRLLRRCLGETGGAELLTEGDSFFAAFADATDAVRACIRAQRALAAHPWPGPDLRPRVRMGLHTGYAVATDGEYASLEVHRAARVAAAAAGDQVLCTEATAALLGHPDPATPVRPSPDPASLDRAARDRAGLDRAGLDRPGLDRAGLDRAGLDRAGPDRPGREGVGLDSAGLDSARADSASGDRVGTGSVGVDAAGSDLAGVELADLGLHRLRGFDDRTRLYQIVAPGLARDFPRPKTVDSRCHNLPEPLTRFVGRGRDRAELAALVRRHRLVTVWGTGGVGKTRLAVEVARDLLRPVQPVPASGEPDADRFADGAWLVDVADLGDAARQGTDRSVAGLLATRLGLRPGPGQRPVDALVEHLQPRRCLLLLDTCELARGAVRALLSRLLASCPTLRVLATGRTPLGLPGETLWHLGPLGRVESTELLTDRLGAGGDGRLGGLARMAGQLAGLPAALELAVPRLHALPAAVLTDLLGNPDTDADAVLLGADPDPADAECTSGGVAPARHGSLRANLAWSYRLLTPPAARLLRWLAAWPGEVDLAAVEWLTADWLDRGAACVAIADLVDAALVEVDLSGASATYRVLGPVRWPARRLAAAHGELDRARARHQLWQRRLAWVPTLQPLGEPVAG